MDDRIVPEKLTLENGLTVLLAPVHDAPVVATLLLYRAGSACEPPGRSGVAHVAEHMMFQGTHAYPEGAIDEITGRVGGSNNAVTTADHASYHFVVPSDHWRAPLEIEADRMRNCTLEPARFATEKRIVLEERGMVDDDPEAIVDEAIDLLAIDGHPYRRPVVGLREDLERLTLDDLRSFYDRFYQPANAVLAVVGDFDAPDARAAVGSLFGPIEPRAVDLPRPASWPAVTAARNRVIEGEHGTPEIVLAFRIPPALHADTAALEALSSLLGEGRGSRLHDRLVREDDLATDVTSYQLLVRDPSLHYIAASLHEGVDPAVAERAVVEVLADLATSQPDDEETERAVGLTLLDTLAGRESYLGLAAWLGLWESLGGWERAYAFEESIRRLRCGDLGAAARTYLAPERRSSVWLVPTPA